MHSHPRLIWTLYNCTPFTCYGINVYRSGVMSCFVCVLFCFISFRILLVSQFQISGRVHTEKYFLEVSEAAPRPAEYRFVCQKAVFKHNLIVKRLYLMQVYLPKKFCKHYNIYKNIFDRIKPRQESCLIKLPFMVLLTFLCFED